MKAVFSSLNEIPEAHRSEYESKDGKYALKLEGDIPGFVAASELAEVNKKLTEFRDNNRSLNSMKSELEAKNAELEGKIAGLEKKGVREPSDVEAKIARAVEAAVAPVAKQLEALQKSEADAKMTLAKRELESTLTGVGLKVGIDERALPDYLSRGLSVFTYKDGKIVAANGEAPVYSKRKPTEPLTVEEWASELSTEAPHLFKPSKGGGASPGQSGGGVARRTISNDPLEFGRNAEAIAKGEVVVSRP